MSAYSYYEVQAVDRALTPEQKGDLRAYSSRAQINASSFVNVYNWGSLWDEENREPEKTYRQLNVCSGENHKLYFNTRRISSPPSHFRSLLFSCFASRQNTLVRTC